MMKKNNMMSEPHKKSQLKINNHTQKYTYYIRRELS